MNTLSTVHWYFFTVRLFKVFIFSIALIAVLHSNFAPAAGVDLHAHLFMKRGLGILFSGSFDEPLQAQDWKSRFGSQANSSSVMKSDLDILVVALYAHPLFTMDLRESIRAQIRDARRFVRENPTWIIATTPQEARAALDQRRHVLVLSLEGAAGVLETEEDILEFVDREGIRIVTFFHLTDDHLGGAALLDGIRAFASPLGWFKSLLAWNYDPQGILKNTYGISKEGKDVFRQLLKHQVWIDLAHAPEEAFPDLLPMLARVSQPLLFTHTSLRKNKPMERSLSQAQVDAVKKVGGMIGLMPSVEMLGNPSSHLLCKDGIYSFAQQFNELSLVLPSGSIAVGSDFNGGIYHLKGNAPECGDKELPPEGFWNIGQYPEFWAALEKHEPGSPTPLGAMAKHFLDAWSLVKP